MLRTATTKKKRCLSTEEGKDSSSSSVPSSTFCSNDDGSHTNITMTDDDNNKQRENPPTSRLQQEAVNTQTNTNKIANNANNSRGTSNNTLQTFKHNKDDDGQSTKYPTDTNNSIAMTPSTTSSSSSSVPDVSAAPSHRPSSSSYQHLGSQHLGGINRGGVESNVPYKGQSTASGETNTLNATSNSRLLDTSVHFSTSTTSQNLTGDSDDKGSRTSNSTTRGEASQEPTTGYTTNTTQHNAPQTIPEILNHTTNSTMTTPRLPSTAITKTSSEKSNTKTTTHAHTTTIQQHQSAIIDHHKIQHSTQTTTNIMSFTPPPPPPPREESNNITIPSSYSSALNHSDSQMHTEKDSSYSSTIPKNININNNTTNVLVSNNNKARHTNFSNTNFITITTPSNVYICGKPLPHSALNGGHSQPTPSSSSRNLPVVSSVSSPTSSTSTKNKSSNNSNNNNTNSAISHPQSTAVPIGGELESSKQQQPPPPPATSHPKSTTTVPREGEMIPSQQQQQQQQPQPPPSSSSRILQPLTKASPGNARDQMSNFGLHSHSFVQDMKFQKHQQQQQSVEPFRRNHQALQLGTTIIPSSSLPAVTNRIAGSPEAKYTESVERTSPTQIQRQQHLAPQQQQQQQQESSSFTSNSAAPQVYTKTIPLTMKSTTISSNQESDVPCHHHHQRHNNTVLVPVLPKTMPVVLDTRTNTTHRRPTLSSAYFQQQNETSSSYAPTTTITIPKIQKEINSQPTSHKRKSILLSETTTGYNNKNNTHNFTSYEEAEMATSRSSNRYRSTPPTTTSYSSSTSRDDVPLQLRNKKMKATDCLLFAATLLEHDFKHETTVSWQQMVQAVSSSTTTVPPLTKSDSNEFVSTSTVTTNNYTPTAGPKSNNANPFNTSNSGPHPRTVMSGQDIHSSHHTSSSSPSVEQSGMIVEKNGGDEESISSTGNKTKPRDVDVLCGRGGLINKHPGNVVYRKVVDYNKPFYQTVHKKHRILVSQSIVQSILNYGGRFLILGGGSSAGTGAGGNSKDEENWIEIGFKRAVQKTSQALRERTNVIPEEDVNHNHSTRGEIETDGGNNEN